MIIAAYAGVGKSYFEKHVIGAKDLVSMPYSWILQSGSKDIEECEKIKGAPYLVSNPLYPDNYIAEILRLEKEYKYLLIPPIYFLLSDLRLEYNRPYILCYPTID